MDTILPARKPLRGDLASRDSMRAVLGNAKICRVFAARTVLDGVDRAYKCTEHPRRVPCNLCNPSNPVHGAIISASKDFPGSLELPSISMPSQATKTDWNLGGFSTVRTLKTAVRFPPPVIKMQHQSPLPRTPSKAVPGISVQGCGGAFKVSLISGQVDPVWPRVQNATIDFGPPSMA
ncbi:hypothetical protein JVT61DRAFT_10388 [Boletus reticuloceps]|uniref:Uncharacterized protein n=1 Tax=Boletus reticuloceps TaxID=495285 RepID=A0A8I2YUU9_9AGAM|nr:hypothetical protein JVT61DRAFT_10388 [Boletus reticuloceps]